MASSISCLPVNSSLGYLAKCLGALKPVPWDKVKLLWSYFEDKFTSLRTEECMLASTLLAVGICVLYICKHFILMTITVV